MRFFLYCFAILSILLVAVESYLLLNGSPGGDYWQHAAVIKELSLHPLHPSDPITGTNNPHAFFSPYSLLVAGFSSITGFDAFQALKFFSFFNLVFLIFSFYCFSKSVFKDQWPEMAFTGLLLILFFWGKDPWMWSGFLHFWTLDLVLSYPSSFAMALSFFILSVFIGKKDMNWSKAILIILLITILILTHPTTAVIFFIAMICFQISSFNIRHLAFLIVPIFLCLLWPYYNIIELFIGDNTDFHDQSRLLYDQVLSKTWPALLVLPGLWHYKKNRVVIYLAAVSGILLLLYLAGYIIPLYGLSRMIPGVMIFVQLLVACFFTFSLAEKGAWKIIYPGTTIIVLAICLYLNRGHVLKKIYSQVDAKSHFLFLGEAIQPGDLVLADKASNEIIPAFNGKVLATAHPMYWVRDSRERRKAVEVFFSNSSGDSTRQAIIRKYRPKYLLLNKKTINLGPGEIDSLLKGKKIIYQNESIRLVGL